MTIKAEEAIDKRRRREVDSDGDAIQTLLNSLTLEQIKESIFRLAPTKRIPLRAHSQSFEALLHTGADNETILSTLLDVERSYPFKHCLMLQASSENNDFQAPMPRSTYKSGGFEFILSHVCIKPIISLTFEHEVEVKEWVNINENTRVKKTVVTRQPIIVRFQLERKLLTLSYPGITNVNAIGSSSSTYEDLLDALLRILKKEFNWSLKNLPIKNILKFFVEGSNRRVLQVKADVDTPMARFDVSAKGQNHNIEEALADFIADYLPAVKKEDLIDASKKAFSGAVANSIVLFWMQEGLFTRIRFWDIGTELHFVWNNESASYRVVDEITYTLSDACDNLYVIDPDLGSPLNWIVKQKPGVVLTPGGLAQKFTSIPGNGRATLISAMKSGLVEPVYRLKTSEILEDISNDWTSDLDRLGKEFITVNGGKVDGGNPENIEVAFRRVASMKGGE